jgi:hypothetical protein
VQEQRREEEERQREEKKRFKAPLPAATAAAVPGISVVAALKKEDNCLKNEDNGTPAS